MSKKTQDSKYVCNSCGYESVGWLGKCPACQEWNSLEEMLVDRGGKGDFYGLSSGLPPKPVSDIKAEANARFPTDIKEVDRTLGGGLVLGSTVLIGGSPGIGKSTLLLQISSALSNKNKKILYVSGEESVNQIKLRAGRLNINSDNVYVLSESNFEKIEKFIKELKPDILILDSIQAVYFKKISSSPGSILQIREVTSALISICKTKDITAFLVGHVTKEGNIAGPKLIEHMVDVVLYFEGSAQADIRFLKVNKNRFGSTEEMGIFSMGQEGLIGIEDPSSALISGYKENNPGTVIFPSREGRRSFLVEIQSLTGPTNFGMPRRTINGIDYNRVAILLAVLERKVGLNLGNWDIFINVIGGISVYEPAVDLSVCMAVTSSFKNKALKDKTVVIGEVGLTGEVRPVHGTEMRVKECLRFGFNNFIIPKLDIKNIFPKNVNIKGVLNIKEALDALGLA
jgi:DNA repair protein RadA/Sms